MVATNVHRTTESADYVFPNLPNTWGMWWFFWGSSQNLETEPRWRVLCRLATLLRHLGVEEKEWADDNMCCLPDAWIENGCRDWLWRFVALGDSTN